MNFSKRVSISLGIKIFVLGVLTGFVPAHSSAQEGAVSMPKGTVTVERAFQEINDQTGYVFSVNNARFDVSRQVSFDGGQMSVKDALAVVLDDSGASYLLAGKDNITIISAPEAVQAPANGRMTGVVLNAANGLPLTGVSVSLVGDAAQRSEVGSDGRFALASVPAGAQKVRVTYDSFGENYYTEVEVPASSRSNVELRVADMSAFGKVDSEFIRRASIVAEQPAVAEGRPTEVQELRSDPDFINSISVPRRDNGRNARFAVKTNLLYGAGTLTPNLGFEMRLSHRSTLDLWGGYNPWNRKGSEDDNDKLVHVIVQPEYRWWLCESFNGHFFGAHLLYSNYNIAGKRVPGLFKKDFHYEGNAYGAGVSYGYHAMLSKRLGLEFTVGVGYIYTEYDKYKCMQCGDFIESKSKNYFGPTKAGISLVYMIK